MDKETLSNYGWIVICVLVLAVMIALAGPFGNFVAGAVKSTTAGLFGVNKNALGAAGIEIGDQAFANCEHTYENYKCTQCGHIQEHTCNYENSQCTVCGKELPAVGVSAEDCTWDEIKAISEAGKGDEYFNLGDTKTITTTDGKTIVMEIVAFNADTKADGTGKAGITWISKNAIAEREMNAERTNAGGWLNSEMREWLQGDFYSTLPDDLKNNIVSVNKSYYDYNSGSPKTNVCSDNVWIPSSREIHGSDSPSYGGETSIHDVQYTTYFNSAAARIKNYNGSAVRWWLRSAYGCGDYTFRHTWSDGRVAPTGASNSYYPANTAFGVVLGFCI